MSKKRTQVKLAGKVGVCPRHLSKVKVGTDHLGAKAARKIAKVTGSDPIIWMSDPSNADLKARITSIDIWCQGGGK